MKFKVKARDILLGLLDVYVVTMWSNPYGRCRKEYYEYFQWRHANAVTRNKVHRSLNYLKKRDLIGIYQTKTGKFIELTDHGKRRLSSYFIKNKLKLPANRRWDGKWRVVMFDIAEGNKVGRDVFRGTLKRLGFYPLQKSVFVYPYECYKEIVFIRDFYGLKGITYGVMERIEVGVNLLKIFSESKVIKEIE